jgi:inosose dehydratase
MSDTPTPCCCRQPPIRRRGQRIRIGNAPCSWGVLEFELEGEAQGADQVLWEMDSAGFEGTELGDWGFMPTEPGALRALLKTHNLELVGAFVPVALANESAHEAGVVEALKVARLLAAVNDEAFIVLADDNGAVPDRVRHAGRIRPDQGLSDAQWAVFARGAEAVARAVCAQTDLRCVFHHHCAGFVETPAEVAALMARTSPELLGLCLDMGHYAFGGGDPLQALEAFGDRCWHIHYKDFDAEVGRRAVAEGWDYFEAVRQGVFCELGQGVVDFGAITAALRQRGHGGWIIVEQDVLPGMGSPFESARRNRAFLRTLAL